ncbi:hypothetical protein KNT89_gp61 [Gordonia phage Petra]|uniref:Uncharacterized protein n=2 Tax=root TaxID=1 RepID=A0A2U8UKB9_9CAUD|nr:hypothetical protein [Gordonia westfalica]YP_010095455.1 hypothetical protein KNT89_gp61 [Gordonia phage Petra]AWN04174.1 hypothetical protein PBI_PETRA_61 [Gordonia phage Petra]SDU65027.1 hypothetical protein SAMN04488548_1342974 [Gordonia westfalica]
MRRFTIPDHNRLQATADQLEADGSRNADEYRKRYEAAQSAYDSIVELGKHSAAVQGDETNWGKSDYQRGESIARFLVEDGWTPPNPMGVEHDPDVAPFSSETKG